MKVDWFGLFFAFINLKDYVINILIYKEKAHNEKINHPLHDNIDWRPVFSDANRLC